jgi:hypothetical protein
MAKSEPNMPENEQTAQVAEAPAPEMSAEEAATLAHEGEAALHDIGDDGLEPPTPFDIPAPGDVVVPFDKINEIMSEKQEAEKIDNANPKKERKSRKAKTTRPPPKKGPRKDPRPRNLNRRSRRRPRARENRTDRFITVEHHNQKSSHPVRDDKKCGYGESVRTRLTQPAIDRPERTAGIKS